MIHEIWLLIMFGLGFFLGWLLKYMDRRVKDYIRERKFLTYERNERVIK